jgi:glutamate---cysteine ligase / carboxylate-amine ligase
MGEWVVTSFGMSTPYSVGVEEELALVRAGSLELVAEAEPLLAGLEGEIARRVKPGLFASVVELSTPICTTVAAAVAELAELRNRVGRRAAEQGLSIASVGTHPFSCYREQPLSGRLRSQLLAERLGWLACRQLVFGLHIQIGVSSAAKAVACVNGLRAWLPQLLSLSANSPFWQGCLTGLASTRAAIIAGLPRSGPPPYLNSFTDYQRLLEPAAAAGCLSDDSEIWWDIRPRPRLGTVEVRICDAQARLENVAALVALVQSLAAAISGAYECGTTPPRPPEFLLEENRLRALRDGLQARLVAVDGGHKGEQPVAETITALVDDCLPAADALGCSQELSLVAGILARGNGADEQRHVYQHTHDPAAVTQWLADQTASHLLAPL